MKQAIITFSVALSFLLACEERIDLSLPSQNTGLLAVEGVLTNENINHKITLTLPYQQLNGKPTPATGATVTIQKDNEPFYPLTEFPVGSGEYLTPVLRAAFGSTYTLTIQFQGNEYVARDSSIPVEPIDELDYRKENDAYVLTLNQTGQIPNYIDHQISWQNTPACVSPNDCEGRIVFYDLKTIDAHEIFKPAKTDFFFPAGTIIIRKKYSVSDAYRAFLRSVLSETEWRGAVFDIDRANTTTNLSAGAIGFFAVASVVSDTTRVVEKP